MLINQSYIRTAPTGEETQVVPKSQQEVEYYKSLEAHGYKFAQETVIHSSPAVCTACEG